jgi:hypothetical protein
MLQENSFKAQLTLFSVTDYELESSRFGSTVVKNDNLLTGTDEILDLEIPVSKLSEIPVSKSLRLKRSKGLGTGRILEKEAIVVKGYKEYKYLQYWFAWEEWHDGSCQMRSKYIPKRLRDRIIGMNAEKLPVEEILKVLSGNTTR